jgi:hypothetical protein
LWLVCAIVWPIPAEAAELKAKSLETFKRYVRLTEARIAGELERPETFLYVDQLPPKQREAAYALLKSGGIYIAKLATLENGKPVEDSDCLIHHWVGVVFVPGANLERALGLLQDYNRHAEIYAPEVNRSRLIARNGDHFQTSVRFVKKKVITVVTDTDHEIQYFRLDNARAHSRTYTTRVQQVENHGKPDERLLPPGKDDGFLWQLYTYWRLHQKDGGVYIQCESLTLTRDLPPLVGPLIRPFVQSVPRESLDFTLRTTRTWLVRQAGKPAG